MTVFFDDKMCADDFRGKNIVFLEETDSTNDFAKALAKETPAENLCVVASRQIKGKGRMGRSWAGATNEGVYLSMILKPCVKAENVSQITLMAGVCVSQILNRLTCGKASIKWPNDVVVSGKKICGILTEAVFDADELSYVVLGIGINVNQSSFPEELAEKATSLCMETGHFYPRKDIILSLISEIERYFAEFNKSGIDSFIDDYRKFCINKEKEVLISENGVSYRGKALGISRKGELIVEKESGEISYISSGEVSVRGIYGYV